MNNLINPYDLRVFKPAGVCRETLRISDFVKQAQKQLKQTLVESQIEALGIKIEFSVTRTRFGGERLWFRCPCCSGRAGNLYRGVGEVKLSCRKCLRLRLF